MTGLGLSSLSCDRQGGLGVCTEAGLGPRSIPKATPVPSSQTPANNFPWRVPSPSRRDPSRAKTTAPFSQPASDLGKHKRDAGGEKSREFTALPLPQGCVFEPAAGGRQPAGAMNKYPGRNPSGERGKGRNIDIGIPPPAAPAGHAADTHTLIPGIWPSYDMPGPAEGGDLRHASPFTPGKDFHLSRAQ